MPDEKESQPPPDGPPGFTEAPPAEVQELAASVSGLKVDGDGEEAEAAAKAEAPTKAEAAAKAEAEKEAPEDLLVKPEGLREQETEIKTVSADDSIYQSAKSFDELGLSPDLLQGIYNEMRFEKPSKIQATTLPMILKSPYKDLIAQAHNGSGKTTCFVLAMLSRVNPELEEPQALCVCPTRELVIQNEMVLRKMGKYTKIQYFTTAADDQFLGRGKIKYQVIVGTHGKLKGWFQRRMLELSHMRILVFDEADEMLKADGFADDSVRMIKEVRKRSPGVQLLLFSATFSDYVRGFAEKIAPAANKVFVPRTELSLDVIAQYNVCAPTKEDKTKVLRDCILPNCEKLGQTIVFVRTREAARQLHNALKSEGYKCTSITGDMEKTARDNVVAEFREGRTKILIATDVLSRGFDVSQVTLVINYDVPVERDGRTPNYETYLHRIGRSGRFGRKGAAFNLICGEKDKAVMDAIARYYDKQIQDIQFDNEDKFVEVLTKAGLV